MYGVRLHIHMYIDVKYEEIMKKKKEGVEKKKGRKNDRKKKESKGK